MKKFVLVCIVLALAAGVIWCERQHVARAAAQRERLRVELDQARRRTAQVEEEAASFGSALAARSQVLQKQREQIAADAEALRRTAKTNAFGPPGGCPVWSETEPFIWLEKRSLTSLGIAAFRDPASEDDELSESVPQLMRAISRRFLETYPEFGRLSSLSLEETKMAQAAFISMLEESEVGLNEKEREAVEAAIHKAKNEPRPGAMTQPPAVYRLNQDAATLLGMTTEQRDAVDQVTRETIGRYQELERRHVSTIDQHAEELSGFQQAQVTFKVAAFPEEGEALKGEWITRLNGILGADRAQHLAQMSAQWINSDLGDFGEAERTITIREDANSGGFSDKNTKGYRYSQGTGGPASIPAGWRHLIVRSAAGGLPRLRGDE
jgi:hypothetical protein